MLPAYTNRTRQLPNSSVLIETKIVDLASGEYVASETVNPASYNQLGAALSEESGRGLDRAEDPAGIRRLEKYSLVYLVREGDSVPRWSCRSGVRDCGPPCMPMLQLKMI